MAEALDPLSFEAALTALAQQAAAARAAHQDSAAPQPSPRRWGEGHPRFRDAQTLQAPELQLDRPQVQVDEQGHAALPHLPPLARPQAEIRNTNEPASDWIAQHSDPEVGRRAQQFLNAGKSLEETPYLGPAVRVAEELTGAPSIARGGLNIKQGIEEGSKARIAGGAAQVGVGAIPVAAGVRAVRPALGSVPGIVTTAALGGAATALPSYAEETAMKTPKQQALDALIAERKAIQDKVDEINSKNKMPDTAYSRRLTPEQLKVQRDADLAKFKQSLDAKTETYRKQLTSLDTQIERARGQTLEEQQSDLPFRQRHPEATAGIMGTAMGLAALGPGMAAGANAYKTSRALRDIAAARAAGDEAAVRRLQTELTDRTSLGTKAKYAAGGTAAGGLEYTLASALPEEIDAQVGTPKAQHAATDKLSSWDYWLPRAALGGLAGLGGTGAGFTGAKIMWPQNTAAARGQIATPYTPPRPGGGNGGGGNGPMMLGPGAWPPEARRAAREYMATTGLADPLAVRPSDVASAMASRGVVPNANNVASRLAATKNYITDPAAPVGSPLSWADIMNAPASWKGQRLLSAAPAAALPGMVIDRGASPEGSTTPAPSPDRELQSDTVAPPAAEPTGTSRSRSSSSPELPEHLAPTPWGVRDRASGKFTKSPDSSSSIVAPKDERKVNSPPIGYSRPNPLLDLAR